MYDYNGTNDQYYVDCDPRGVHMDNKLSISDYNSHSNGDTRVLRAERRPRPVEVNNYEDKYQFEQQNIPAYYRCDCAHCPMSHKYDPRTPERPAPHREYFSGQLQSSVGKMDNNILLLFLFLIVIFISCFCMKSINELRSQIEKFNQLRTT